MVTGVLVALGSNVGDRRGYLREAISRMQKLADGDVESSSIYLTDPQDMEDDAEEFANAAVHFATSLTASELLRELQQIEVDLGRPVDHGHNVSRTIDLDIILFQDKVIDDPELKVPHPRAHQRRFVLMPLAEIAPEAQLGEKTVREWLAASLAENARR